MMSWPSSPPSCFRGALVLSALSLLLSPSQAVRPSPLPSQPEGASWFHSGDDALSWSSNELQKLHTLHGKNFQDKNEFLAAGNIASYLGFSPIEALHLPIPLTIVFVGFQGDGNLQVDISTSQLQEWFGHLDHVIPHTRVQLSELTCAEDGHCSGLVHGVLQPEPVHSYVHLNFSCNVVVIKRRAVVTAFEHALHVFSRPVDPEIEMGAQQVDAIKMEAFMDHFLRSLGVGSNSNSLVVLNPTWSVEQPVYGYRVGMSQKEVDLLITQKDKFMSLLSASYDAEPALPGAYSGTSWMGKFASGERSQTNKFGSHDMTWNSEVWVKSVEQYLSDEEQYRKEMLKAVGRMSGAAALVQGVRLLRRRDTPMAEVLRAEVLEAPPHASQWDLGSKFRTMHTAEDCQVGNWVGHSRWAMLDLTAGGFDWGPALGGDGVVTKATLPNVLNHFSHVQDLKKASRDSQKTSSDHALLDQLAQAKVQHVGEVGSRALQAFSAELAMRERSRGAPGQPSPMPDEVGMDAADEKKRWARVYQETVIRAEMDVIERMARRHCGTDASHWSGHTASNHLEGMEPPVVACQHMKEEVDKLKTRLSKLSSAQAVPGDVYRDHKWDIFGITDKDPAQHDMEVTDTALRSHDLFLAELSSILSRAIRHVIAPPTATWTRASGQTHGTATPFATHVTFDIHIITEEVRHRDLKKQTYRKEQEVEFDLEGFKSQVASLKLDSQTFDFAVQHVQLNDDPVLATAFASSLRSAQIQIPDDTETTLDLERLYLDSRALSHVLRRRFEPPSPPSARKAQRRSQRDGAKDGGPSTSRSPPAGSKTHATLQVPVFVFEVHRDVAILIDTHYNAKALQDMILVVQNAAQDDEHPTGMMCGGALIARPLSPLRDALSATLTYLGGVLPPHLGYNPRKKRVTHDWLWSVGAHPQSFTSVGTQFTQLQRDALARSYLLDGLDSCVDLVNEGMGLLSRAKATPRMHAHILKHQEATRLLLSSFTSLISQWRDVLSLAWTLEWGRATQGLALLEDTALGFLQAAKEVSSVPEGQQCTGLVKGGLSQRLVVPVSIGSVLLAGSALLYLISGVMGGGLRGGGRKKGWQGR